MPNHVTNILLMSPEVANAITRNYTEEEIAENRANHAAIKARVEARGDTYDYPLDDMSGRVVDFAMVIPEPENIFHGGCDGQHPHRDESGRELVCWYSWNVDAWGTKWNAYSPEVEPTEGDLCRVKFQTAWSHPFPVVEALALKFPDEEIYVEYADEDFGSNLGTYLIKGGEVYGVNQPADYNSAEAKELAARVLYGRPYAEVQAEWDADNISWSRKRAFAKRLEAEGYGEGYGEGSAYRHIQDNNLPIPDDIVAAIPDIEASEAYDADELVIPNPPKALG
jgi:hypothetical protein